MIALSRHLYSPGRTLAVSALLLAGCIISNATVVWGPFLEGATTTNAYVLAECDSTSPLTVNFGVSAAYGSSAATSFTKTAAGITNVHRIKLTGLSPNTLYHYQLTGQGFTSADYTFRTLAPPGTPFRFAWKADFRNGTAVHDAIARLTRLSAPVFVLEGGDTCDPVSLANWHSQYFSPNQLELAKWCPIYPSPGNHEGWGTMTQAYYQSPDSSGADGYYSFDCGDVHFTMANYRATLGFTNGSPQWAWIQQDAQSSLKPWKIFGTHAPAYAYGSHGGDTTFQQITTSFLEPNGYKVYLGGHNHYYQHNLVRGVRHLTVGTAGAPLAAPTTDPTYTVISLMSFCYLIADVSATNLHMAVFNESSNVLDVIDLFKPPAPVNVAATPANFAVGLSWQAVRAATNYTVYYGTSNGGPYPSKKNSAGTNTTVSGLANGTTYYFVVTASDTNGPSGPSAQVSAVPVFVPPQIQTFAFDAENRFELGGTGIPGQTYILTAATNLVAPIWQPVLTNVADGGGGIQFIDATATNYNQRYYRVSTP